jgi:hypothetical protein
MYINFPVHCNVALAVDDNGSESGVLPSPPPASPSVLKSWQHPGFSEDPRKMVSAMARCRNLITRSTASNLGEMDSGDYSVLTHVSKLASKWDLIGYTFDESSLKTELGRGPVCGAISVRDPLLTHISSIMSGKIDPLTPYSLEESTDEGHEHGFVCVVVLKCTDNGELCVALPWGKFPKKLDGKPVWDGCVHVDPKVVVNLCGMSKRNLLVPNLTGNPGKEEGVQIRVMPKEWFPATTKPLPSTSSSTSVDSIGKMKNLKGVKVKLQKKSGPKLNLKTKFTDENISLGIKCVVTSTIIILSILILVLLKTRRH